MLSTRKKKRSERHIRDVCAQGRKRENRRGESLGQPVVPTVVKGVSQTSNQSRTQLGSPEHHGSRGAKFTPATDHLGSNSNQSDSLIGQYGPEEAVSRQVLAAIIKPLKKPT